MVEHGRYRGRLLLLLGMFRRGMDGIGPPEWSERGRPGARERQVQYRPTNKNTGPRMRKSLNKNRKARFLEDATVTKMD